MRLGEDNIGASGTRRADLAGLRPTRPLPARFEVANALPWRQSWPEEPVIWGMSVQMRHDTSILTARVSAAGRLGNGASRVCPSGRNGRLRVEMLHRDRMIDQRNYTERISMPAHENNLFVAARPAQGNSPGFVPSPDGCYRRAWVTTLVAHNSMARRQARTLANTTISIAATSDWWIRSAFCRLLTRAPDWHGDATIASRKQSIRRSK